MTSHRAPQNRGAQPDPFAVPATRQPAGYDEPNAVIRQGALTAAERFWYVLGNIALAAMYFAKVPAKKAFAEAGLAQMTGAERFWYVLMCVPLGAGYFAKLPVKKALTELLV